jgi:death-on-curing protein
VTDATEYLDVDDLVTLAVAPLGNPPPIRDLGLLAAAAARPQASAFGDDAYPDLWTKAAALLHSVVKNHPLVDGNNWLACAVFLDINGTDPTAASNNDVYDLVMHVAAQSIEIERARTPSPHHREREWMIGRVPEARRANHEALRIEAHRRALAWRSAGLRHQPSMPSSPPVMLLRWQVGRCSSRTTIRCGQIASVRSRRRCAPASRTTLFASTTSDQHRCRDWWRRT